MDALFNREKTEVTRLLNTDTYSGKVGAFEGANYESRGFYRPEEDCIMFTRDEVPFCQVCQSAISRIIDLYTGRLPEVTRVLLVALGGALGSVARYGVGIAAPRALGTGFPWGTLLVNLVGSFLIALVMHLALTTAAISPSARLFLTTGVMGGFTTYSSFNYETLALLGERLWGMAALNVGVTLAGMPGRGSAGPGAGSDDGRGVKESRRWECACWRESRRWSGSSSARGTSGGAARSTWPCSRRCAARGRRGRPCSVASPDSAPGAWCTPPTSWN